MAQVKFTFFLKCFMEEYCGGSFCSASVNVNRSVMNGTGKVYLFELRHGRTLWRLFLKFLNCVMEEHCGGSFCSASVNVNRSVMEDGTGEVHLLLTASWKNIVAAPFAVRQ